MKIGIQHNKGNFSDYWVTYFNEKNIPYKLINCYDNDIVAQVSDCDIVMWHYHHANYRDALFAKGLLFSLQQAGKIVFPDFSTSWHFDDKVGQKYLLESIGAPVVPSYAFYDRPTALAWAKKTFYPKVFKLRGGAGSSNVRLINSEAQAVALINKSFGAGFSQYSKWQGLADRVNKYRNGKATFRNVLGGIARIIKPKEYERMAKREKGYFYAQDFIDNNDSDIRVIIIGDKAFAIKRMVRKNDFRASGSGSIIYEKENFDNETLALSFEVAGKLRSQCCAFDFVYDKNKKPLIVEISFGFNPIGYTKCVGYWNRRLEFFEGPFNPYTWIVDDLITVYKQRTTAAV
ncbi:MAG TPA: hypothetical protein VIM55_18850 [Mucilaginibacter sp.]